MAVRGEGNALFITALFLMIIGIATLIFGLSVYSGNDFMVFSIIPALCFVGAFLFFMRGLAQRI